jgi:toluene monooxygenase system protein D
VTRVGPVLEAGDTAAAVIAALREGNPDVLVVDRGAYLRALSPLRCVLRRDTVERLLGRPFHIPSDLERVMPSFVGTLAMDEDQAVWTSREAP